MTFLLTIYPRLWHWGWRRSARLYLRVLRRQASGWLQRPAGRELPLLQKVLDFLLDRAGVLVLMGCLFWVSALFGSPQVLMLRSQNDALKEENEALKAQLAHLDERMAHVSSELDRLANKDQTLYRALLKAESMPRPTRAFTSGIATRRLPGLSKRTASLVHQSEIRLDQLERDVYMQNASLRELTQLARVRNERLAQMPAILPADGPVVSGYGMRWHPILDVEKMHTGIDLVVEEGTPVYATGAGVVEEVGQHPSYGTYVRVAHEAAGYVTLYAHLSEVDRRIRAGRPVERGAQLGWSGSTGRSSGPHLHYEVLDQEGHAIDPMPFFAPGMTPQRYQALRQAAEQALASLD